MNSLSRVNKAVAFFITSFGAWSAAVVADSPGHFHVGPAQWVELGVGVVGATLLGYLVPNTPAAPPAQKAIDAPLPHPGA